MGKIAGVGIILHIKFSPTERFAVSVTDGLDLRPTVCLGSMWRHSLCRATSCSCMGQERGLELPI
jgi:hypothetical protein